MPEPTFKERFFRDRLAALVVAYEDGLANQAERVTALEAELAQTRQDLAELTARFHDLERSHQTPPPPTAPTTPKGRDRQGTQAHA